jgi:protein CpxP
MKRLIIPVFILTIVLMSAAIAQQGQQKLPTAGMGGMGMMHGNMQGMMGGQAGGPMAFLKLTDEQKTKIQDLHLALQKEVLPVRAELQKQRANLKLELTADKFNEGKVKSIEAEISKLTSDIALKTALHQRAVRDLLTPDQKKQFDQHILSGGPMGQGGGMGQGMMMGRGGRMGHGGMMGGGRMMGPKAGPRGAGAGTCPCMK